MSLTFPLDPLAQMGITSCLTAGKSLGSSNRSCSRLFYLSDAQQSQHHSGVGSQPMLRAVTDLRMDAASNDAA